MDAQELLSVLNDHGFSDTGSGRKMAAINDAIFDICAREPWPFLETTINLTFDGSSGTPTNFPTDFRAALDLVVDDTGVRLLPIRLEQYRERFQAVSTEVGEPRWYYFIGTSLRVFPVPESDDVVVLDYIKQPVELADSAVEADIVIPSQFHQTIAFGALAQLYDMEDDPELSSRFDQRYEKKLFDMRNQLWQRQFDRPDVIEVVDPDPDYLMP